MTETPNAKFRDKQWRVASMLVAQLTPGVVDFWDDSFSKLLPGGRSSATGRPEPADPLDKERLRELALARLATDTFSAVRGLADWMSSHVYDSRDFTAQPLPELTEEVRKEIASGYGVEETLVQEAYVRLGRGQYALAPVGLISNGRLAPSQEELNLWVSQFEQPEGPATDRPVSSSEAPARSVSSPPSAERISAH